MSERAVRWSKFQSVSLFEQWSESLVSVVTILSVGKFMRKPFYECVAFRLVIETAHGILWLVACTRNPTTFFACTSERRLSMTFSWRTNVYHTVRDLQKGKTRTTNEYSTLRLYSIIQHTGNWRSVRCELTAYCAWVCTDFLTPTTCNNNRQRSRRNLTATSSLIRRSHSNCCRLTR